jgi:hypothetical protein
MFVAHPTGPPSRNFRTASNAAKDPINVIVGDDVKCFIVFVRLESAKLGDRSDPSIRMRLRPLERLATS